MKLETKQAFFRTFFKKYSLVYCFFFIFAVITGLYLVDKGIILFDSNLLLSIILSISIGIILLGFNNLNKSVNELDFLNVVFIFILIYECIVRMSGDLYPIAYFCILGVILLVGSLLLRIYHFKSSEENSTNFFFYFFNKVPVLLMVGASFISSFALYYLFSNLDLEKFQFFLLISLFVLFVFYCIFSNYERKKIIVMDFIWIYLLLTLSCYAVIGFTIDIQFPVKQIGVYFYLIGIVLSVLALGYRVHSFEGEVVEEKHTYFKQLIKKYNLLFPYLCGLCWMTFVGLYTTGLFGKLYSPNLVYGIALGFIVLLGIIVGSAKKTNPNQIGNADYFMLIFTILCFFSEVFLFGIILNIIDLKYIFDIDGSYYKPMLYFLCFFIAMLYVFVILFRIKGFSHLDIEPEIQKEVLPEIEEDLPEEEFTPETEIVEPYEEEVAAGVIEEVEDEEEPLIVEEPLGLIIPFMEEKSKILKLNFLGRLMYASEDTKRYYSLAKNLFLSYGIKSRFSSSKETYRKNGIVAVMRMSGKYVNVYLSIRPEAFIDEHYPVKDVSSMKQYEEQPTMIRLKSLQAIEALNSILEIMALDKNWKYQKNYQVIPYEELLIPNGEAVLAMNGFSKEELVPLVNAKSIPACDISLSSYVPVLHQEQKYEDNEIVYLDTLCNYFEDNEVINLEALVSKKLISNGKGAFIKARGTLTKSFIIYANEFEEAALKMIYFTNGTAVKLS